MADALGHLPDETVIDGELVILDDDDYPDFAALIRGQGAPSLLALDLLALAAENYAPIRFEDPRSPGPPDPSAQP